ncbi:nuclear pore complex protein Nup88 protein [Dioscorea alata]|uniref:Nuclear pore complex protein Nup88 protein n=1 Tax=Dioscorea alata TaxID=55571 RepID=A0ACB7VM21_DIOAL|nr:nuclear pore complex protein Nup88 protein [Dioscorea alata]
MEPRRRRETIEWLPLPKHPAFIRQLAEDDAEKDDSSNVRAKSKNLAAWHASSSLFYLWDPVARCVHRLSLRFSSDDPAIVEAAFPSEKLVPDNQLKSDVHHLALNVDGSFLLLTGPDVLSFMNLHDRSYADNDTIVCRTLLVGSKIYFGHNNGLQTLQASWHPYSSTHLGVLSSDSVFRLFDLLSNIEQPEQEYFLEAVEPGKCYKVGSICPVAFSFGGQHLWERFSVFVLFSDGSIYVLCPVVPFGSFCSLAFLEEIYKDISSFGLKSLNAKVVGNSSLAISWLETTFPDLANRPIDEANVSVSRAQPYAPPDASLSLQGPLVSISHSVDHDTSKVSSLGDIAKAVGFLYSSVGKDSVLVIAWSDGHIQIDALADEIQPLWNVGSSPHLRVDPRGSIVAVAMICETGKRVPSKVDLCQPHDETCVSNTGDTIWLGHPPPLLRLAIIDLALPKYAFDSCAPTLFSDPLVSDRFYCVHAGGVDLITLYFLPFSYAAPEADKVVKAPSVCPILTACLTKSSAPILWGFVIVDDSDGLSQIVGITSSYECIMLETKKFNDGLPLHFDTHAESVGSEEDITKEIISKELLSGPKVILVPPSLRSVAADSIEGRSTLHHYIKLLHENYVEYAHKVYVELKEHGDHLKTIISDQQNHVNEAMQKLSTLERKEASINDRISRASHMYEFIEQRLQSFKKLPGSNKKPLSKAELDFQSQLDRFAELELDALQSSIDALNARLKRYVQSSPVNLTNAPRRTVGSGRNYASDSQLSQLKSSLEKLSIMNNEIADKVKIIEHELDNRGK